MKRELAKPYIMIDPEGTVQNIAMCDNYEEANQVARAVYGDTAFADEYKWLVQPGDRFRDGVFYTVDGDIEEPAEYIPTEEEQIIQLSAKNSMQEKVLRMQAMAFTDAQALVIPDLYLEWEDLPDGTQLTRKEEAVKGTEITIVRYNGLLYRVAQSHKKRADWEPGQATASLFTVINVEHAGTLEDPIPAVANMEYIKGRYYIEDGVIYLMNREGMEDGEGITLQYLPSQLVGQYFEVVNK